MRGEPFRRPGTAFGIHAFSQRDGGPGIMSGPGHQNQTDPVGFGFVQTAVRQKKTGIGADTVGLVEEFPVSGRLLGQGGRQRRGPYLGHQALAHALVAMAGNGMGDLMAQNDGQAGIVLGKLQKAAVDHRYATWTAAQLSIYLLLSTYAALDKVAGEGRRQRQEDIRLGCRRYSFPDGFALIRPIGGQSAIGFFA